MLIYAVICSLQTHLHVHVLDGSKNRKFCKEMQLKHFFKMGASSTKLLLLLPTVMSASPDHTNHSHHDGCIPERGPGGAAAAVLYEKSTLSKLVEQGSSIILHDMLDPPRYCQWINYEYFPHLDMMCLIRAALIYTKANMHWKQRIICEI